MTPPRNRSTDIRAEGTLQAAKQTYLKAISKKSPESTFYSHQTAVNKFLRWWRTSVDEGVVVDEYHLITFIQTLSSTTKLTTDTLLGNVTSLCNFFSFLHQKDPEILKHRVASCLVEIDQPELETLANRLVNGFLTMSAPLWHHIETVHSDLHRRNYGTRTHVYAMLIGETKSRPEQLRQLDLADISLENNSIEIGIPDTFVVSKADLTTSRTLQLSADARDALSTYVEHERKSATEDNRRPLFTTAHGRVSTSTMRRSIKRASEAVNKPSSQDISDGRLQTALETDQIPVLPRDIRRHSFSKIGDGGTL